MSRPICRRSLMPVIVLVLFLCDQRPASSADPAQPIEVDLFQAVEAGQIEAKVIAKSTKEARIIVKNNTDKPLTVKMPDGFAAMPILAQQQAGGGGGVAFNVPPEKVAAQDVPIVCLEHGKRDPRAAAKYELRPIREFTTDGRVIEVLKMLGEGQVSQPAAQAAAWHLLDGLSWQELASKQVKRLAGVSESFFSAAHIREAMQATMVAAERAKDQPVASPGTGQ